MYIDFFINLEKVEINIIRVIASEGHADMTESLTCMIIFKVVLKTRQVVSLSSKTEEGAT